MKSKKTTLKQIEKSLERELLKAVKLSNKLGKGLNPANYDFTSYSVKALEHLEKQNKIRFASYSPEGKLLKLKARGYWIIK